MCRSSEKPLFSILMCTWNSAGTLEKAVNSVIQQTCKSWELLVLDNGSADASWDLLQKYALEYPSIKVKRLDHNIGWAKGISVLLPEATGSYMTFLAADDFFVSVGSLAKAEQVIMDECPDIVFNGYIEADLDARGGYSIFSGIIPKYRVYDSSVDKLTEIYEEMKYTYYNSAFNFVSIQLLVDNGLNYDEPFYGDCEVMTEAMCRSKKAVVLDEAVYALTRNTAKARDKTTYKLHTKQWGSIMQTICSRGTYDRQHMEYIAFRIMRNNITRMLKACNGCKLIDRYMNIVEKTGLERFRYLEESLETEEWGDMIYYTNGYYTNDIMQCAVSAYTLCRQQGYTYKDMDASLHWIHNMVEAGYEWNGSSLLKRNEYGHENFEKLEKALCCEDNRGVIGFEMINDMLPYVTIEVADSCRRMSQAYTDSRHRRIDRLQEIKRKIHERNCIEEEALIDKECEDLM